jgi:alcohol dehydrogenase class IV
MLFEFATATKIVFGPGASASTGKLAAEMGTKAFVVTGSDPARAEGVLDTLRTAGLQVKHEAVLGEPTIDKVGEVTEAARSEACDLVIAAGGGSVIDTGKAVAALLANGGTPLDYLEGIGRGQPITKPSLPFIAIPTTAGTGSEVTKNSVLGSPEHGVKVSMRSSFMLPSLALVDPELTYSVPPDMTAATGLDALTQCLEAYLSCKANPMTDALCREGLIRAGRSLAMAYHDGNDPGAREDMSLASLFSGLALANAGLGAVHGFAGPLGGLYQAPHGALCARLLPFVLKTNVQALQERGPGSGTLEKTIHVARWLTGNQDATTADGERWVHDLCEELKIPGLATYGLNEEAISGVVEKAKRASSMRGNPIELEPNELTSILLEAL